MRLIRWLAIAIISIASGLPLTYYLARLFDYMNWNVPVFRSWGMAHGGFIIAWPTLSILCALILSWAFNILRRLFKRDDQKV